jgi:hypothetical protein
MTPVDRLHATREILGRDPDRIIAVTSIRLRAPNEFSGELRHCRLVSVL